MVDGVCTCASTSFAFDGGCEACISPCLTCENFETCVTCKYTGSYRIPPPSCKCEDGYYEDSSFLC